MAGKTKAPTPTDTVVVCVGIRNEVYYWNTTRRLDGNWTKDRDAATWMTLNNAQRIAKERAAVMLSGYIILTGQRAHGS